MDVHYFKDIRQRALQSLFRLIGYFVCRAVGMRLSWGGGWLGCEGKVKGGFDGTRRYW